MAVTLYDVLGVTEDADSDAIEAAYRERVKECHPDLSDHPKAEARFRWVVRAEEVLADPAERKRYDRLGHAAYCDAEGWDDGASTADSRSYDDETAAARQGTANGATADESAADDTDPTADATAETTDDAGESSEREQATGASTTAHDGESFDTASDDGESFDTASGTTDFDAAADATGNVGGHQAAERAWEADESGDETATDDGGVDRGGERQRVHEGVYRSGGGGYVGGVQTDSEDEDSPYTRNWKRAAKANEGVRTATAFYLQTLGTPLLFGFALLYVLVAQRMLGLLATTGIYDSAFSLVVVSLTASLLVVGGLAHVVARVLSGV
jgi:curved DNA-binding protein CbpA